jgi:hypothetical protein
MNVFPADFGELLAMEPTSSPAGSTVAPSPLKAHQSPELQQQMLQQENFAMQQTQQQMMVAQQGIVAQRGELMLLSQGAMAPPQ